MAKLKTLFVTGEPNDPNAIIITGITKSLASGVSDNEIPTAKAVATYFGSISGNTTSAGGDEGTIQYNKNGLISGNPNFSYEPERNLIILGDEITNSGINSIANGQNLSNNGKNSFVSGENCSSSGENSQSFGENNESIGKSSHSQNKYTKAKGEASHSGGKGDIGKLVTAGGVGSFNHSECTMPVIGASGRASAILGGKNGTVSHENSVILGGEGITSKANNTVYVPALTINNESETRINEILTNDISASSTNEQLATAKLTYNVIKVNNLWKNGNALGSEATLTPKTEEYIRLKGIVIGSPTESNAIKGLSHTTLGTSKTNVPSDFAVDAKINSSLTSNKDWKAGDQFLAVEGMVDTIIPKNVEYVRIKKLLFGETTNKLITDYSDSTLTNEKKTFPSDYAVTQAISSSKDFEPGSSYTTPELNVVGTIKPKNVDYIRTTGLLLGNSSSTPITSLSHSTLGISKLAVPSDYAVSQAITGSKDWKAGNNYSTFPTIIPKGVDYIRTKGILFGATSVNPIIGVSDTTLGTSKTNVPSDFAVDAKITSVLASNKDWKAGDQFLAIEGLANTIIPKNVEYVRIKKLLFGETTNNLITDYSHTTLTNSKKTFPSDYAVTQAISDSKDWKAGNNYSTFPTIIPKSVDYIRTNGILFGATSIKPIIGVSDTTIGTSKTNVPSDFAVNAAISTAVSNNNYASTSVSVAINIVDWVASGSLWRANKTVAGVLLDNNIICSPKPTRGDLEVWVNNEIMAMGQSSDLVVFEAKTKPTLNFYAQVLILK